MTKPSFLLLFILLVLSGKSQVVQVISRPACCDHMEVRVLSFSSGDSISYDRLIEDKEIRITFRQCVSKVSGDILSFEISINEGKTKLVKGNQFDFKKTSQLKAGGKIRITNAKANCDGQPDASKTFVLPDYEIIIKPSE